MLTRKQESRPTSTFTDEEFKQANADHREMRLGDPNEHITNLINFKSIDLNVKREKLIEILMDLELESTLLGRKPEPNSKYAYTFQWFSFYIEKLKIHNRLPNLLNTFNSKPKGKCFGDPEENLVKLINEKANKLNTKPHFLLPKLVNSYFNFLVKEEAVCRKNPVYFETFQYFQFYLIKAIKSQPFKDVFGHLMNEVYNFDKKHLGQCMTPPDIRSLISSITNNYYNQTSNKNVVRISEDCGCGSGGLILSSMELVKDNKKIFVLVNDINLEMAQISFIQCFLNAEMHYEDKEIDIVAANCNILIHNPQDPEHILCHAKIDKRLDKNVLNHKAA